ncbi:TaqI-like C-terminal specificity domain-containing protein [Elizabethkingia meningoseptica]|uniref:TaqI-like C-terminal specificity domain-containing protein n=1 Tax=Elizabethkingia meningoseptica TaxID=238 RepID=UPI002DD61F4C|nr:TaqI-like C-terminal specificity domain-containing protein [Elizabethkingia meningoseptica]MEC4712859.1 TaqI-like C-terminal specificity domain-containing protein [Elizabethkingia meningoseptica]
MMINFIIGRFNIDNAWFQYGRKQGIAYAQREKLVAPEISLGGNFSYDKNGHFYSTTKIYGYIKKSETKESYLFWLGLFNSKLFWYFIQKTGYVLRGGYFTFKTNYILPFPIPEHISEIDCLQIENLVQKILLEKKNKNIKTDIFEKNIDEIIYNIYNLTEDEISEVNT